MTSATDKLRLLLDERGVEWWEEDGHTLWYGESLHHAASAFSSFMFGENERVHLNAMVTPEQAVEATLGRGTCHAVFEVDAMSEDERVGEYVCSECGETFGDGRDHLPNYCPNCGRRIEQ